MNLHYGDQNSVIKSCTSFSDTASLKRDESSLHDMVFHEKEDFYGYQGHLPEYSQSQTPVKNEGDEEVKSGGGGSSVTNSEHK